MTDTNPRDGAGISRRRLLQLSGGTVGVVGLGSTRVAADDSADDDSDDEACPETTIRPSMVHYDDSIHEVCSDSHPETVSLQADVKASLESEYPTVGSLIDAGFVPYYDFFADGSWAHWLNPEFIGDESMLDPDRPESVLVDNTWWRPIGVMFIATDDGDPVDPPPTIYVDEGEDENDGTNDDACIPWHAHVGFPGRLAWSKYWKAYENETAFPCRTPWMLHVWKYAHPESIYAHGAPDERGGPPAEDPGFETDADPDEEELGPEHLPDAIRDKCEDLW